jgi:arsenate reductase (thioredoxin)
VSAPPFRVLVLCPGNSARSQIAEALLTVHGAGRIAAASAGSRPAAAVNPHAIDVLRHHGITWEPDAPKSLEQLPRERFDLLVTVCDDAAEECPYFAGARARVHWGLPDPAGAVEPEAARHAFERTYGQLARRIEALLALPLEAMAASEVAEAAGAIHRAASAGDVART